MTHSGSCHCGNVKYEVEGLKLDKVISCNCSMCSRTGTLLEFVPVVNFRLLSGEDSLIDYQFNKHVIHHVFCKTCGVKSFARGSGPGGQSMVAINVRCLEGVDPDQLAVTHYDGKSH